MDESQLMLQLKINSVQHSILLHASKYVEIKDVFMQNWELAKDNRPLSQIAPLM